MSRSDQDYDNQAMQALSDAGAQCGNCGDEPGDWKCPDCERCYRRYVDALRKAGWAPRAEVLREAADIAERHERSVGGDDSGHLARSVARGIALSLRRKAADGSA
ncbi:hypothetical protein [Streptomyces lydicus]|uniref:hypothetical protein n=1 Tax=Streptomyces lydicus TaxID=47763 RepID=UPI0037B740B1